MMSDTERLLNQENYPTEAELVQDFLKVLDRGNSPWGELLTTTEWDYRSGFTDVLARTHAGELVAFEAKLSDWKRATHQAYRNTTFVKRAYVVMPSKAAKRAVVHREIFTRYGIGLCTLEDNGVSIMIEAPQAISEPLLPWMHKKAQIYFDEVAVCESRKACGSGRGDLQAV